MSHNTNNPAAMAAHYATQKPTPVSILDIPEDSVVLDTDSYKVSMWKQYPPGTEYVHSYIEARGGKFPNGVFFGLQFILKLLERRITVAEVEFANRMYTAHGEPFNYEGWMYIARDLNGKLPILIEAVEEGTVIPVRNTMMRITNTDPKAFWLTTWVETILLRGIWYATTVATLSWSAKQVIRKYLEETCENPEAELPFKLHDFGSRGASSREAALRGGTAHLVNFLGTDTTQALVGAMKYYGAPMDPEIKDGEVFPTSPGYSIPAAEHSTVTSWGKDGELDAFRNMLNQFGGANRLVAVVSDSYDIYKAVSEFWGTVLKEKIIKMGGTLVVRPDSGDPAVVPLEIIERLGERFGYTVNKKGFKVLPSCVRLIQGDGIDLDMIGVILANLKAAGWSAENIAFGMGGGLLQRVDRDTMSFAMKCSAILKSGETVWVDVFKDPITDPGKKSKSGRLGLALECGNGSCTYHTKRIGYMNPLNDLLKPVFRDGEILRTTTLDQVRARSNRWGTEITSVMPKVA